MLSRTPESTGKTPTILELVLPVLALALVLAGLIGTQEARAQPTVVDPDWALARTIEVSGPMSARFHPLDGAIYFGRRGSGADGLYRLDDYGFVEKLASGSNIAGVAVDPATGDIFVSEDYGGVVYRTQFGGTGRSVWVSGFAGGDDDPIGMDFAPPGHSSGVLLPGEGVVVDRGYNGADGIWWWSPTVAEGEYLLRPDDGTLVDAVDVAIGDAAVYVADTAGIIYTLAADSTLTPLVTSEPLSTPEAVDVDPVTGELVVLDRQAGRLVRVDPASGQVDEIVTGLSTGGVLWAGVEVHPSGRRLLVTDWSAGAIHLLVRPDATGWPELDCDGNGLDDLYETALGLADDCNRNGRPDVCDLADNDCNLDGRPDDCPVCPPVQAVFIMDTSTSMDDEAAVLCSSLGLIVDYLQASDIAVQPSLFGICDLPGGGYSCLQGILADSLGTAVPGFPPPNLAVLGDCPGGDQVCQEDWGRATAVAAGSFPWLPAGESIRLVIPVSDEGPWCGDGISQDDLDAIAHAINVARDNDVIVSPITGTGSSSTVIALAREIAAATGGVQYSSSEAPNEIAAGIVELMRDACASFTDCDLNGVLDECELADHPSWDWNGDGILDRCQQGQGFSGAELGRVLLPSLHPCFPNPFNPRTTIAFDLPRRQAVSLRIYDVGGRLVRTLLAGEVLDPGRHEVTWMGRDDNGRPMGSGTYFSRLEAEGFHATRRMVLLK